MGHANSGKVISIDDGETPLPLRCPVRGVASMTVDDEHSSQDPILVAAARVDELP